MTPKEKAKELVYWYENLLEPFIKDRELLKSKAKQCALICVREMKKDRIRLSLPMNDLEQQEQAINKQ